MTFRAYNNVEIEEIRARRYYSRLFGEFGITASVVGASLKSIPTRSVFLLRLPLSHPRARALSRRERGERRKRKQEDEGGGSKEGDAPLPAVFAPWGAWTRLEQDRENGKKERKVENAEEEEEKEEEEEEGW